MIDIGVVCIDKKRAVLRCVAARGVGLYINSSC